MNLVVVDVLRLGTPGPRLAATITSSAASAAASTASSAAGSELSGSMDAAGSSSLGAQASASLDGTLDAQLRGGVRLVRLGISVVAAGLVGVTIALARRGRRPPGRRR